MLVLPDCKMTFVCGPVASGKTWLIKKWISTINRYVAFDSTGEYSGEGCEEIWHNPAALHLRLKSKPYYYRIVYVPGRDRESDFEHVSNAIWWRKEASRLLVCDEVADICPVDYLDGNIEMILRFTRKAKLGFLAASQRIADVHKLFTGGCRMVVLYQTNEARDLEAIDARWRCAEMVENLRPLIYDDDTGVTQQIPQCVVIEKGKKPYVYDFQTESRILDGSSKRDAGEVSPAVEESSDAPPSPEVPDGEIGE